MKKILFLNCDQSSEKEENTIKDNWNSIMNLMMLNLN